MKLSDCVGLLYYGAKCSRWLMSRWLAPESQALSSLHCLQRINGDHVLAEARAIVALGPRYPGSSGAYHFGAYLRDRLQSVQVEVDPFVAGTTKQFQMRNYIVRFRGNRPGINVIASHYDTPFYLRASGFVGANDGASSSGLLVELAKWFSHNPPEGSSVWLVWLDGEEALERWAVDDSLYGSKHLVERLHQEHLLDQVRHVFVADMIGADGVKFESDLNSSPVLYNLARNVLRCFGHADRFRWPPRFIEDDHISFMRAGIPSLVLIDYQYGPSNSYWHTPADTTDKLSADSLALTGNLLLSCVRLGDALPGSSVLTS